VTDWKFIIPPPHTGRTNNFFIADPINHPNNTPGVMLLKRAGEKLSETCCCDCLCCENIPDTIFALVSDNFSTPCCGTFPPGNSTVITLSKVSNYIWRGSGSLSWCTGGTLTLTFRCTGDLIDCEGNPLPGPCDGSGGMCLSGTLVADGNSCPDTFESRGDHGCHPVFNESPHVLCFDCCENGTNLCFDIFIGP